MGLRLPCQLFFNGLSTASVYVLIAVGVSLVYSSGRFFDLAHAIVFTTSAYMAFLFSGWLGLPLVLSLPLAIASGTIVGCLKELCVYRWLRRSRASSVVLLLASLGTYIALQNVLSLVFGDTTKTIRPGAVREGIGILGARITLIQVVTVCTAAIVTFGVAVLLTRTRFGIAVRAVADDPELAVVSGVNSDRVILLVFAVSSVLAGIAGVLVALDVDMKPTMGLRPLMMGIVAMMVGGVGSIPGIALGALLLGMAQHLGVWKISSQWQDAIAFSILLAFLLFRPQGFLGKRVKKATV